MKLDPSSTALVLIECQNDFMTDGGAFHPAVEASMTATSMAERTRTALDAARAAGTTVMHAPISFVAGYGELGPHPFGILKGVVDHNAFVKGSWGAEIIDDLAPADGDILIEGKRGLDVFATTNLDFILRSRQIKSLVLTGFLTNCCVESTMRTGFENGFEVVTLADCMAATSVAEHDAAVQYTFPMFSTVSNSSDFVAAVS
jgi:nicotinamidase-related amidase